ncbi:hypothetical protein PG990_014903 [Apiospora arundinis]|uniref:Uncharacterized protein n=1 Tax=Apiospora arundinis TaxID=335852 RepID=A0ABR2HKJ1_9PEZI
MGNKGCMKLLSGLFLDFILYEAVFWCTVVILITTTAVLVGFQLRAPQPDDRYNTFLSLLWTAILQLLVNYCTIVPVIREQRQRHHLSVRKVIRVNYIIFYGSVAASVVATILSPVLMQHLPEPTLASGIATFISNVFSAIAASQLAAGITSGLQKRG